MPEKLTKLEAELAYTFSERKLLEMATCHSSYINEAGGDAIFSNERLEFLGDAVLGMIVASMLYERMQGLGEGRLTSIRSRIVKSESLADFARQICLGDYLMLGRGADKQGERNNNSLLEDAFEALVAAIYLDGGFEAARRFVHKLVEPKIEEQMRLLGEGASIYDYKTALQIELQKGGAAEIKYEVIAESGPDHDKTFRVCVSNGKKALGEGEGRTKKCAEQMAAKMALEVGK